MHAGSWRRRSLENCTDVTRVVARLKSTQHGDRASVYKKNLMLGSPASQLYCHLADCLVVSTLVHNTTQLPKPHAILSNYHIHMLSASETGKMTTSLPLHRRWAGPTTDRFAPAKPRRRHFRGKHHLLVSVELGLSKYRCLTVSVQCLGLAFLLAAVLLLAQSELGRTGFTGFSSKPVSAEQHRILLATHNRLAW
jgi:hypothetical protein